MHIVFAVSHRESLISEVWADELYRYLSGVCKNRNHFVHAINGTADHVHMLIGMNPTESVASLLKEMKGQSSKWINEKFMNGKFRWQSGYGAFSYSRSLVPAVKRYIERQKEHHQHVSFQDELVDILNKAGIDYNPDYIMKGFIDSNEKSRT